MNIHITSQAFELASQKSQKEALFVPVHQNRELNLVNALPVGTEAWHNEIAQLSLDLEENSNLYSVCSSLGRLPCLLDSINLEKNTAKTGNRNAAIIQWGKQVASSVKAHKIGKIHLGYQLNESFSQEEFTLFIEGLWFGIYEFEELKAKPKERPTLNVFIYAKEAEEEFLKSCQKDLELRFAALRQTLKLVLSPANICTPSYFSKFAQSAVEQLKYVQTDIWGEDRLRSEGMNLILAVGQGSPHESQLLMLEYNGAADSSEHIALVGKGVCFDTGGTNLKPSASIKGMQYDMMGAGVVYGAFYYLAASGVKANIKAYIPLVENQIGSSAIKTGDIITAAMGQSVEINNTDAEGRLILADTLFYAASKQPQMIIDCATLTGAAVAALGELCAAFYSNNEKAASLFANSSYAMAEDAWQMPLFRPYAPYLQSKLADLSNISTKSSTGGSITAALFLEPFALSQGQKVLDKTESETDAKTEAEPTVWLHLDLASWSHAEEHPSFGKNNRAMGLRLLSDFILRFLK